MKVDKVCLLSTSEAYLLEVENIQPDCSNHRHSSRKKADELEDSSVARRVKTVPGKRRLVRESARTWTKVTPRICNEKLGTAGMQFTSGRAGY